MMNFRKVIIGVVLFLSVSANASLMVRTSPILLVVGGVNGELDYGVTENLSVGAGGLSWSATVAEVDFTVTEAHARIDYWTSGIFKQGWYFNAVYSSMSMELNTSNVFGTKFTGKVSGSALLAGVGYHWQWDSFHTELGVQAGKYDFDSSLELEASDGSKSSEDIPAGTSAGLEFNIGWVF